MPQVLIPLARGFEEIEFANMVSVLKRAGVDVAVAGLAGSEPVRGSRGIDVVPDLAFDDADGPWDLVALPGGNEAAENMMKHDGLVEILKMRANGRRMVAAICAGPRVLDKAGVLVEGRFTCYPGIEDKLSVSGRLSEAVVDAGPVITSQGPATAMRFALHLVERLTGATTREEVEQKLLYQR